MKTDQKIAEKIIEKALAGERLNLEDGILLHDADLHSLSHAATLLRNQRTDVGTRSADPSDALDIAAVVLVTYGS